MTLPKIPGSEKIQVTVPGQEQDRTKWERPSGQTEIIQPDTDAAMRTLAGKVKAGRILVRLLSSDAKLPVRGSEKSAGLDLHSTMDVTMDPMVVVAITTGLAIRVPDDHVGLIRDRSGLAIRGVTTQIARISLDALTDWFRYHEGHWCYGEHPLGGVLDSDYRGEVKVLLINTGTKPYQIKKGERVAQLLVLPVSLEPVVLDAEEGDLDDTARGAGGLGSTGR